MPSHYNHICLECRTSNRHGGLCHKCGKPMAVVGSRLRIPKRGKSNRWKELKKYVIRCGLHHLFSIETAEDIVRKKEHEARCAASDVIRDRDYAERDRQKARIDRKKTHIDKMRDLIEKLHG